jgi:hypothetical protein
VLLLVNLFYCPVVAICGDCFLLRDIDHFGRAVLILSLPFLCVLICAFLISQLIFCHYVVAESRMQYIHIVLYLNSKINIFIIVLLFPIKKY